MGIKQRALSGIVYALFTIASLATPARAVCQQALGVFIDTKDVTRAEMAELRRLAQSTGRNVWLVYGFRDGLGAPSEVRHTRFQVYLEPEVENTTLHRGRMLLVDEPTPARSERATDGWRVDSTGKYVQVIDPQRHQQRLIGRWDIQRAFPVHGEFSDNTLLELVALIRSNARGPNFGKGEVPDRVDGSLPITQVRRTNSRIEVVLTTAGGGQGEFVTLEERDGGLVVVKVRLWIA